MSQHGFNAGHRSQFPGRHDYRGRGCCDAPRSERVFHQRPNIWRRGGNAMMVYCNNLIMPQQGYGYGPQRRGGGFGRVLLGIGLGGAFALLLRGIKNSGGIRPFFSNIGTKFREFIASKGNIAGVQKQPPAGEVKKTEEKAKVEEKPKADTCEDLEKLAEEAKKLSDEKKEAADEKKLYDENIKKENDAKLKADADAKAKADADAAAVGSGKLPTKEELKSQQKVKTEDPDGG